MAVTRGAQRHCLTACGYVVLRPTRTEDVQPADAEFAGCVAQVQRHLAAVGKVDGILPACDEGKIGLVGVSIAQQLTGGVALPVIACAMKAEQSR